MNLRKKTPKMTHPKTHAKMLRRRFSRLNIFWGADVRVREEEKTACDGDE